MPTRNQTFQLNELRTIESLITVYAETSALWMKKARERIISRRGYLDELNDIFQSSFSAYLQDIQKINKRVADSKKITLLAHNGKKVSVLYSTNTGLYGDIVQRTFRQFLNQVREKNDEVTIIGRRGRAMFLAEEPHRPFTFFELPDSGNDALALRDVIYHLVPYEEITLFSSQFVSLNKQETSIYQINANPYANLKPEQRGIKYLFEPNLGLILAYFEKQMFATLLEQQLKEGQLAHHASRMSSMQQAKVNLEVVIKKNIITHLRTQHQLSNRKQLDQYRGIQVWQRI